MSIETVLAVIIICFYWWITGYLVGKQVGRMAQVQEYLEMVDSLRDEDKQ